jgi:probable blue pigment (indigoidine) exporter
MHGDTQADARTVRKAMIACIAGVIFFSTGPPIIAGADLNGLGVAFWRLWLSFAVLTAAAAIRGRLRWSILRTTAFAGISFGLSTSMFFTAAQTTSVANATLIAVLQPLPLLIIGRVAFGEAITGRDVLWISVAVGGAVAMVVSAASAQTGDLRGDLLAVGSLVFLATYFSGAKEARKTLDTLPFMVGLWFWSGVVVVPILLVSGNAIVPTDGLDWVRIAAIAVMPGAGHVLVNYSHTGLRLAVVGLLQLLTPVTSALFALAFLGQTITLWQVAGMAVVLVALGFHSLQAHD